MKALFAIALGIVVGLILPHIFGRELRVIIVHELKLPVKGGAK